MRAIILMHKRALHKRHALQHILQALAQIVAVAEMHAAVEDDVDLDVELVAGVVGLQALDLFDRLGEAHGEVEEDCVWRRGGEISLCGEDLVCEGGRGREYGELGTGRKGREGKRTVALVRAGGGAGEVPDV